MSRNALRRANAHYTWATVADRVSEVYREVRDRLTRPPEPWSFSRVPAAAEY
jgi:hypothetical protein